MNNKHVQYLMYAGTIFLVILSLLAIISAFVLIRGNRSFEYNTISVNGSGEIDSAPNLATFSFTVQENSKTADQAQSIISEKVSKILAGLTELGIEEKDIKTEAYTIYPQYEWLQVKNPQDIVTEEGTIYFPGQEGKQVQTGFDVSQNISLKLRDFEKVPELLTLLGEDVQNLNGPNFQVEDPAGLEEQARALAIKDAKQKAAVLAGELGVKLGDIVSFNEDMGAYPYPEPYMAKGVMMDMAGAESAEPQLPTGQNTITKNVTILYKIK